LIQPLIDDQKNTLTLTAKDQSDLTLPIKPDVTKLSKRQVQLWKHKLDVYDMGDHAAQWVNQFLSNNRPHDHANSGTDETSEPDCRLVTVDDPQNGMYKRPAHPKIPGVHAAFQDWSPISLGFNSSLDALNDGMVDSGFSQGSRIPITRFRNNITISGTIAWEEDEWLVVK
jgi:uncharacterized protein YcbX